MRRFIKNDRLAWSRSPAVTYRSFLLLSYPQYTTRCGRAQAGGVR
jgi:hypothetical protein